MMHTTNGAETVRSGTPVLIVEYFDFILPIFTRCLRWHKNSVSHLITTFGSPIDAHLVNRVWWSTLSSALLKSKNIMRTHWKLPLVTHNVGGQLCRRRWSLSMRR